MCTDVLFNAPANPSPGLPMGPSHPWLAPLAGFSDLPFRLLCRELGAAVACTEMVSAKGLVLGQGRKSGATNDLLRTVPPLASVVEGGPDSAVPDADAAGLSDRPLVVQLFGAEPEYLGRAVAILKERGYEWFDLNMGCSVPKVGKSGAGSAMLADPDNAVAAGRAMLAAAGPGRVGFKLRLGRSAGEEVHIPLARRLEDAGAGWLTLHPRYAKQGFAGRADRSAVADLARAVSIPVLASGDLFTAADGLAVLKETGASGVMFARGAMRNPAIFREFSTLLGGGVPAGQSPAELEWMIRRHMDLVRRLYPVRRNRQGVEAGLLKMRTFVPRYVKHCAGARALRRAMAACDSWGGLDELLAEFFGDAAALGPSRERDEDGA